jgi:hypothetical protein
VALLCICFVATCDTKGDDPHSGERARHQSDRPHAYHVLYIDTFFQTTHTMPSLGVLLIFLTSCLVLYTGWDWGLSSGRSPWTKGTSSKRPNIVFVLTDDQDLHMNSLDYMPHTQKLIADQGTTFTNHFCTNALCCPSRVTLWTGLSPHNTNVTDVNPPHGAYNIFRLILMLI